jgi:2-C-methyl-D-erythritol 2,4-cyclodiphosphate synthase
MTSPTRVGIGYDIHRLVAGRRLVLAGVEVPHTLGTLAHSDGDVVFHAVADAMLGAAGLGDLGEHFPDTDPAWKDADSANILDRVYQMIKAAGWEVVNVDVNILLEKPKLVPHKRMMRSRLYELLWTKSPSDVSVKARTMEGLGPIGAGEAVAAHAVVLLCHT